MKQHETTNSFFDTVKAIRTLGSYSDKLIIKHVIAGYQRDSAPPAFQASPP